MKKRIFALALFMASFSASAGIKPPFIGSFLPEEGVTINRQLEGATQLPFSDTAIITITQENTYHFQVLPLNYSLAGCKLISGCISRMTMGGTTLTDENGTVMAYDATEAVLTPGTYTLEQTGMLSGKTRKPGISFGAYSFKYWGDAITPVAGEVCQGTAKIVNGISVSKLFMQLDNGVKVAYSNVYGSPGTTVFSFVSPVAYGTFPVGANVSYHGVLDASLICVPDTLTVF